ncbi:uncharacterized protein LOC104298474 [Dryobates pubescens]|nr:uncharacterized protein LOC104298474 [Dryobates pubescens]
MSPCLRAKSHKGRLIRTCHNLHDLVYFYVSSTNKMFRLLNQHLGTNFPIMTVKEHFSIEENLQLLVSALKEMQTTMETKNKEVQESIAHSLYKTSGPTTSLQDQIVAVKELYENYKGIVGSIVWVLVAVMLKHGFPDTIEAALHHLSSSPALSLQVSELLMDYAYPVEILRQKEIPCTTEGCSSSSDTAQQFEHHSSSFLSFIQSINVLKGQRSIKKILKAAADYLEETFMVLKPPCEGFQTFVKMAEVCISTVIDLQKETSVG